MRPSLRPEFPAREKLVALVEETVMSKQRIQHLCELCRVLSDQTRLTLLLTLQDGEKHVSELCRKLRLPQPTVSHHLGLLRIHGMVRNRRRGKLVFYSTNNGKYEEACKSLESLGI